MSVNKKIVLGYLDTYLDTNGNCVVSESELKRLLNVSADKAQLFAIRLILNKVRDCKPVVQKIKDYRHIPFHSNDPYSDEIRSSFFDEINEKNRCASGSANRQYDPGNMIEFEGAESRFDK